MTIGCKTGGPGEGVSYRGSHGQTVRVGRSAVHDCIQVLIVGAHHVDRSCKFADSDVMKYFRSDQILVAKLFKAHMFL